MSAFERYIQEIKEDLEQEKRDYNQSLGRWLGMIEPWLAQKNRTPTITFNDKHPDVTSFVVDDIQMFVKQDYNITLDIKFDDEWDEKVTIGIVN